MNIKIQAFQISVVLWLARVQSGPNGKLPSESSEEVLKLIDTIKLPIIRGVGPYIKFKEYFINNRKLEKSYCDVVNDLHNVHKETKEMNKEIKYFREIMPHIDFICALNFMKYDLTEIFTNVAGVEYTTTAAETEWPFRIQQIRRIYDDYDEDDCRMYSETNARRGTDHKNYKKWLAYVSTDPILLEFTNKEMELALRLRPYAWVQQKEKWRSVATHLQGNLTQYFNNLCPELRKLRYNDDKKNFSSTFAAVIQRGHRLSCYFEHTKQHMLETVLREKYPNGTSLFFGTGFQRIEPKWYFPAEHIDMFNILINATHHVPVEENDLMYIALQLPHPDHDNYIIPGKKNCAREPFVPKREAKYTTKLTAPTQTITFQR